MGTRGLYGFYFKGKFYVVYNHWDSYARGLGAMVLRELIAAIDDNSLEEWKKTLESFELLPYDEERVEKCSGLFEKVLTGCMIQELNEYGEPYWQEYAYVVNIDENTFEFYARSKHVMSHNLEKHTLTKLLAAFESAN